MKRNAAQEIAQWKNNPRRKPLLLRGARQVGKSYLVEHLIAPQFPRFLKVNLEERLELRHCFEGDLSANNVIAQLEVMLGSAIDKTTLLFIDEIQAAPRAVTALRYLYEQAPDIPVIAAGSLLEFGMQQVGVPVGRVTFLTICPLTFEEYLLNSGNEQFLSLLKEHDLESPFSTAVHNKGLSLLREYLAVGGMPEVCDEYLASRRLLAVEALQGQLLEAYRNDFPKYAKHGRELERVGVVFDRTPQLVGKVLKLVDLSRDYQARDLRSAIDLLERAEVIHKILRTSGTPLGALQDANRYKLLFVDVGLMQRSCATGLERWIEQGTQLIHTGSIAEQFVGQQLYAYRRPHETSLYYWERPQKGSSAEVDYLVNYQGSTVPLEVKAGARGRLRSLSLYLDQFTETPFGVKCSTDNFSRSKGLWSIPLYALGEWLQRS